MCECTDPSMRGVRVKDVPILSHTVTKPNHLQAREIRRYAGGGADDATSAGLGYEIFDAEAFPEEGVWKVHGTPPKSISMNNPQEEGRKGRPFGSRRTDVGGWLGAGGEPECTGRGVLV